MILSWTAKRPGSCRKKKRRRKRVKPGLEVHDVGEGRQLRRLPAKGGAQPRSEPVKRQVST